MGQVRNRPRAVNRFLDAAAEECGLTSPVDVYDRSGARIDIDFHMAPSGVVALDLPLVEPFVSAGHGNQADPVGDVDSRLNWERSGTGVDFCHWFLNVSKVGGRRGNSESDHGQSDGGHQIISHDLLQNARSDAAGILDKRMAAEDRSASPRDHFQAIRWRETEVGG